MTSLPPFESVVEEHGPALLRFCTARAGSGQGEDVFQETMIAALRAYPTLREPEAVRAWLYSIAARKAIDAHRAGARAPLPVDDLEALARPGTGAPTFDREIWSMVKELPNKQRDAIGLRFLGELTHAEIAAAMGTTEEAARRNVFEGLRRLRKDHGEDLTYLADRAS